MKLYILTHNGVKLSSFLHQNVKEIAQAHHASQMTSNLTSYTGSSRAILGGSNIQDICSPRDTFTSDPITTIYQTQPSTPTISPPIKMHARTTLTLLALAIMATIGAASPAPAPGANVIRQVYCTSNGDCQSGQSCCAAGGGQDSG